MSATGSSRKSKTKDKYKVQYEGVRYQTIHPSIQRNNFLHYKLAAYPQLQFRLERHGALVAVDRFDVRVLALYVFPDVREGVAIEITHSALVVPLSVMPEKQSTRSCSKHDNNQNKHTKTQKPTQKSKTM